jgi:hypothetical protein
MQHHTSFIVCQCNKNPYLRSSLIDDANIGDVNNVGVHSRKQKIPTMLTHDLFYVVVRQQSSGGVHTLEDQEWGLCSCTMLMKTTEPDLKVV